MVTTNQSQITSALQQAGLGDISTQWLNTVNTGSVSDMTIAPGTHFDWMALKRAGRPGVLRNVRWTGHQSFDAFQFSVEYNGYNYTFIVPKICGNFALLSRTAVVAAATPPPPPPARAPAPAPVRPPPPPPAPAPVAATAEPEYSWMATGYLGTSFTTGGLQQALLSTSSSDGGLTYGMQVAYVKKYVGAEFIGDFAPSFNMSSVALAKDPTVNSYMFNAIGAGRWGWFEPFISGGIGGVTMRTQTFDESAIPIVTVQGTLATQQNTINTAQTHFGSNIGGGFFAYAGQWGIRADVRFYDVTKFSTNTLTNGSVPSDFTQALLSGLNYWRANLGVSFRW